MFELFSHTADVGLRVRASSREELFAEAARGFTSLLVANPEAVRPVETRTLHVAGEQDDYLLLDWLNELLYLFETERWLCHDAEVRVVPGELRAVCRGERAEGERHGLGHEVKAITYHGLSVRQIGEQWEAELILDI